MSNVNTERIPVFFQKDIVKEINGFIPAVITPEGLREILGVKSFNALAELPIPRCYLKRGGKKYVYLATDVLDYLRSQRDVTEVDFD